jgi:hypothetical protein
MNWSFRRAFLAFMLIVLGFALGVLVRDREASAQPAAADSGQHRFRISAFSSATAGGVFHGAYVIDTATGQVWHVRSGGKPEKVADKLE